jgi:hypothetical protein
LDGTTNFVHGYPFTCVSIGLAVQQQPVVGVVYNPMLNEMFTAAKGCGAFLNDKPIQVSDEQGAQQQQEVHGSSREGRVFGGAVGLSQTDLTVHIVNQAAYTQAGISSTLGSNPAHAGHQQSRCADRLLCGPLLCHDLPWPPACLQT